MLLCEPEFRRMGVGTALVNYVIDAAKKQGKGEVRMMMLEANDPEHAYCQYTAGLKRWYEKFGFKLNSTEDVKDYLQPSGIDPHRWIIVPCNALCYRLSLPEVS